MQIDANSKKAMHLINLIKQYQELTLTVRDVGEFLGRRVKVTLEHGKRELRDWSEREGDVLCQLVL